MLKNIIATIALVGAISTPAFANDLLPVHLDLSAGLTNQNSTIKSNQDVEFVTATPSWKVTSKLTVFADGSFAALERSPNQFLSGTNYSAFLVDGGLTFRFSRGTSATVTYGTVLEDTLVPGGSTTVNQASLTLHTRVF